MTKLIYNDNNTEGAYPTSFDFRDTEIRKDAKIVATVLTDLYDVQITNVQDKEILIHDGGIEKWVNGEAGGGCSSIIADTEFTVGSGGDFTALDSCFDWLRESCIVIKEDKFVTIKLLNNLIITSPVNLNHPYGHRIIIDGDNNNIKLQYEINYSGSSFDPLVCKDEIEALEPMIILSGGHSITINNLYYLEIFLNLTSITGCTDDPADYPVTGIKVFNNSSLTLKRIRYGSVNDSEWSNKFFGYCVHVDTNSYVEYDAEFALANNGSTIYSSPLDSVEYIVKNGSTIITHDVSRFTGSTFVNSKLIEYKY